MKTLHGLGLGMLLLLPGLAVAQANTNANTDANGTANGTANASANASPNANANARARDEIERGRQLYMANGCYSCHGTVGQGGERSGAPKLAPDTYPFEAFRALVRTPREAMPRVDPRHVSDEQLQAIHRYLASIAKGPAAQDIPQLQAVKR